MIGGGTLLGLSNLMTGIKDFDKIIEMAQKGNNANVDMLVKDIYGDKSPISELAGDILASSFAKIASDHSTQSEDMHEKYKHEDVLNSLVTMISINIGQLAYYQAQLHQAKTIYFVGSYVRENPLGRKLMDFAVNFSG